jgi:hypothetical protein
MDGEKTTVTCADPLVREETFLAWLRGHGLEPNVIHTVHIGGDSMMVEGYELNADGRKYVDQQTGAPAEFTPFEVKLKEPMPR